MGQMPDFHEMVRKEVQEATKSLSTQLTSAMTENANLKKTCSKLEKRVAKLELENDALEQYGRRNILRVSGIPEEVDKVADDHIIKLANALVRKRSSCASD